MPTTFPDGRYFNNLKCLVTVRKRVIMTSKIRFCMILIVIYFYKIASSLLFFQSHGGSTRTRERIFPLNAYCRNSKPERTRRSQEKRRTASSLTFTEYSYNFHFSSPCQQSRPDTIENQYEGIIDSGRELALMFNILKDQTSTMNQVSLLTS